jgi:thioesterase domain-containing protein
VGEVLVFLGLSQKINDRAVYALRARGFEPGQSHFTNLDEVIQCYLASIRRVQLAGPYVLAGYSYGSMLAFELAKCLEYEGAEVRFLGCLNLPPHIKYRMRQLSWAACLLHLCYFLSLMTEQRAGELLPKIERLDSSGDRSHALGIVLAECDKERLTELQLTPAALENWALLAHGLQSMARDYEPSGHVSLMDVFHAIPLREAAESREDWVDNKLSQWKGFVDTEPKYFAVDGAHYTMLGPDHLDSFVNIFCAALAARGV